MIDYEKLITKKGDPGDFIKVIEGKCIGCRKCEIICPVNLWSIKNKKASLSGRYKELCLECGHCYSICESDAIDFNFPKGGTGVIYKRG